MPRVAMTSLLAPTQTFDGATEGRWRKLEVLNGALATRRRARHAERGPESTSTVMQYCWLGLGKGRTPVRVELLKRPAGHTHRFADEHDFAWEWHRFCRQRRLRLRQE